MKKLFVIALAVLFVAGAIAETAIADERLALSGEMRARAWDKSGKDIDLDPNGDGDYSDATIADVDEAYFDQRFRMGAVITAAEGVKGVLRFDFSEDTWGSDNWAAVRYGEGSELQVDRAYLDVTKGMVNVKAGQQYIGLGNSIVYDNNTTGVALTLDLPVKITLGYTKEDERGSNEDEDATDDLDTYLVNVGYAADNFSINAFYATAVDGVEDGMEPNVFGAQGKMTIGMVNINAELDIFGGEIGDVDVMGTQFFANAEAAVADNIKVGVDLIYSDGNDSVDEIKITALNDFGSWAVSDRGPLNTDIMPLGGADVMDPDPHGLIGDVLTAMGAPADAIGLAGGQGGAIGGGAYVVFTAMEGLDLTGQVMFLSADEDILYDDVMIFNVAASWAFTSNASLAAQYNYTDWGSDVELLDDSTSCIGVRLAITF